MHPRADARAAVRAGAAAILLLAAVLRFWALDFGLPHPMARPDEEVVLAQTRLPAQGKPLAWAVYPHAYIYLSYGWGVAGLRAGQALGFFPPGDYLSVLAQAPDRLILVNRVLSAVSGTATVALVLLLGVRRLGAAAGLAAGALLATNFLHVRDSHAVKPDALLGLFVVTALGAMLPLARRATPGRAAGVGAVIGLATAAKYPGVLLVVPGLVAGALGCRRPGGRRGVGGPAAALLLTAAAVFLATSPLVVATATSPQGLAFLVSTIVPRALQPEWLVRLVPAGTLPPASLPWWSGFVFHASFSLRYGAGLVATLLLPLAVVWGLASGRRLALLAAVFALVYFVVTALSPAQLARYLTPMMPVVALLEGGLVAAVARRVARGRTAALTTAALTCLVAAEPLASSLAHDRIAAATDTRVLATRWMAEHLPAGARVAVLGSRFWGYGMPQMPPGVQRVPAEADAAALAAAGVRYVVTHDHPLAFSRTDPQAMAALAPRLRLLTELDPFSGDPAAAVFEGRDAFYIPFHGFAVVRRPGPRIRIYAFE